MCREYLGNVFKGGKGKFWSRGGELVEKTKVSNKGGFFRCFGDDKSTEVGVTGGGAASEEAITE